MKLLLLGIVGTMIAAGSGAGYLAYEFADKGMPPDDGCQALPYHPESGSGTIRVEIDNQGPATRVLACAITGSHEIVAKKELTAPARAVTNVDFDVPLGTAYGQLVQLRADGTAFASSTGGVQLWLCGTRAELVKVRISAAGIGGGGGPDDCFDPAAPTVVQPASDNIGLRSMEFVSASPGQPAVAVGGLAAALAGLASLFRARVHFVCLLFTRLAKPEILDQESRGRIHALVDTDPGIHASAIADRLELARGEALYHLHVLVREDSLVRVGNWGLRSFFVAGRYSPARMRAMAALRSKALERLYAAVRDTPRIPLAAAAQAAGYSLARASRLARRLEEVGLVERLPEGRTLLLAPKAVAA